ncbi:MAG: hypothetical protein Q7S51_06440 [Gallionellaceae bacterium]|nr:hypothetical protein [Gallionellaceae bacterium]
MSSSNYNTFLAMSAVDGIAVRANWSALETASGVYDWTIVNNAVTAASVAGKKVTLHILPTGTSTPAWLYSSASAASYTYTLPGASTSTTDPVPWDNIYLTRWASLINALADHLTASGVTAKIQAISITAPVPEMSLAACDQLPTSYVSATYSQAWRTTIDAAQSAFPNTQKLLPVPVDSICKQDMTGPTFYKGLLNYALQTYGGGFAMFAADLNAQGSWRIDGVSDVSSAPINLQFIWQASSDPGNRMQGTLKDAICKGLNSYKSNYFEVYQEDLSSTSAPVQQAIQAIHTPSLCN